jgi:hypothetical protein
VAGSALRLIACAGLLTTDLLMAGACAGIAVAHTGDSTGGGTENGSVTSKVEGGSDGASNATKPDPPTSTVGSGRDDIDVKSGDEDNKKNGFPTGSKKFNDSSTVPVLRIPRKDELPASGLPNPCLFYSTLVIPIKTLADVFVAMQAQPAPSPAPGPAFRTQEVAPPVADSGGGGGGGVDAVSTGVAAEPPVLRAPLMIAPLPIPLSPAVAPVAPLGPSGGAAPPPLAAVAAGANVPVIRGSLPPAVEPPARMLTPMRGQATRVGYARYMRTPTSGELAAVALPGVAGLLFLTFSGGCIGYRQANSVQFRRTQDTERFLR